MKLLNNQKMSVKVMILAILMTAFMLAVALKGYLEMDRLYGELESMYHDKLVSIQNLNDGRNQQRAIEADLYYVILRGDSKEVQTAKISDIKTRDENFQKLVDEYQKTELADTEKGKLTELLATLEKYKSGRDKVLSIALEGNAAGALSEYEKITQDAVSFQKLLKELAVVNMDSAKEAITIAEKNYKQALVYFCVIVGIAVLFAGIITVLITNSIVTGLKTAIVYNKKMAKGDFSIEVDPKLVARKDEIGDLSSSIEMMKAAVSGLISEVVSETKAVSKVVNEVNNTVYG